jgi:four helix bundle protein
MGYTEFGCENLEVWNLSVNFSKCVIKAVDDINCDRKHYRLIEQLESSAASVAANIAEGKGRYSKKEFAQHLYIARGSLYEAFTFLKIFNDSNWINSTVFSNLKEQGITIAKKITSLIYSIR